MNNKGQIIVEYILLIIVILIMISVVTTMIINQSEKNQILSAAQVGAQTAVEKNGYSMYYNDTFNDYQEQHQRLLYPTNIKIIKIEMLEHDNNTIDLQVRATTTSSLTYQEKYQVGMRINYYIRQTITDSFNKNATNTFYEPAISDNYVINTKTVKWV